jgi:RNA polymerase sigma factor (sigma-70 family)
MTSAVLVARAQSGEHRAFAEIMSAHERELTVFLYRRVNDAHVAEDLLQDTFLAAWKAIRKTRPDLLVRPWLYKIALNMARQWERKQRISKKVFPLWQRERQDDDWVERNEVQRVLRQMPARDAELLLLKVIAEFDYSEIAAMLDVKPEAVRQRLHRARERFRALYAEEGGR